ncbi:sigma-70 family RNA polymerase sigma factor [Paenibacillus aurantiacus]|uniref:Sigma-70 family RNA polymerase sigma factor n=1 Tax=Paenibacillus aurantiacus TaxID=1936118 RepID=A0ABV5KSU3_9BACL
MFIQYEAEIYRIAYVYVHHEEDALDVVQETAYRSYRTLSSLKEPSYFKTWLIRIAIRCSVDLLRKRNVVPIKSHVVESVPTESGNEQDIALSLFVQEMIDGLDEEEKSVIILRFYYDHTIKELADLLEMPLGTAKTVLYRALGKLRRQIKEDDRNEP